MRHIDFGITFHRNKRSKEALNTVLETIPGIGEKTVLELLKHFKSIKELKKQILMHFLK